jgi:hypothetical protein
MIEGGVDEIDLYEARIEIERQAGISDASKAAKNMPAGKEGECWLCGEHSKRIVNMACAPCRDKYKRG